MDHVNLVWRQSPPTLVPQWKRSFMHGLKSFSKLQQASAVIPGAKIGGISSHSTFSGSKSIPSDGKLSSERSTQQELMSWLLKSWNLESRLLGGMRQDVLHESSGRTWYVKLQKSNLTSLWNNMEVFDSGPTGSPPWCQHDRWNVWSHLWSPETCNKWWYTPVYHHCVSPKEARPAWP